MTQKIIKLVKNIFKTVGIMLATALAIFFLWFLLIAFWPYIYMRKTYDLGDRYLSCEWVNCSDSCRMVFVSKDGNHRAVLMTDFYAVECERILQTNRSDSVFCELAIDQENPDRIIECHNMSFSYGTKADLSPIEGTNQLKYQPPSLEQLYISTDIIRGPFEKKDDYFSVSIRRDDYTDYRASYPKPERVVWIWPLKNPLLKRYPFGEKARESQITD